MPILVLIIAVGFQCVDIFTPYEISEAQLGAIHLFLAPFGLGGLIRAGHKSYLQSKADASKITPEDIAKIKEIVAKVT